MIRAVADRLVPRPAYIGRHRRPGPARVLRPAPPADDERAAAEPAPQPEAALPCR